MYSEIFKSSKLVENQIGKKIKALRSDNGSKYTSKDFDAFYKEARIKRVLILPFNPQQNEVAKRKNWSIIETTKAIIFVHVSLGRCMQYIFLYW